MEFEQPGKPHHGSDPYLAIAECFLRESKGDATEVSRIRRIIIHEQHSNYSAMCLSKALLETIET